MSSSPLSSLTPSPIGPKPPFAPGSQLSRRVSQLSMGLSSEIDSPQSRGRRSSSLPSRSASQVSLEPGSAFRRINAVALATLSSVQAEAPVILASHIGMDVARTRTSDKASRCAYAIALCLAEAIRSQEALTGVSSVEALFGGSLSRQKLFAMMFALLEEAAASALEKDATSNLPKELCQLLDKGFGSGVGGILSLTKETEEWKQQIVEHSQDWLRLLRARIALCKRCTDDLLRLETRLTAGVDLSLVQALAVIGQVVQDFGKVPSVQEILQQKFGRVHVAEVERIRRACRANPLFAEVENRQIQAEVLEGCEAKQALIKRALARIEGEEFYGQFIGELSRIEQGKKVGLRGRIARATISFEEGVPTTGGFAAMPNLISDDDVMQQIYLEIFGESSTFQRAVEKEHILACGQPPLRPLYFGSGLLPFTRHILQPNTISALLRKIISVGVDESALGACAKEIVEIFKTIRVSYSDSATERVPLADLEGLSSTARILYNHHLRTICSISGTTLDIMLGMLMVHPQSALLQAVFDSLLLRAESLSRPTLFEERRDLTQQFKQLFSAIALFMQTGRYHSAGEVLGGLLTVALAMSGPRRSLTECHQLFSSLVEDFAAHPDEYFVTDRPGVMRRKVLQTLKKPKCSKQLAESLEVSYLLAYLPVTVAYLQKQKADLDEGAERIVNRLLKRLEAAWQGEIDPVKVLFLAKKSKNQDEQEVVTRLLKGAYSFVNSILSSSRDSDFAQKLERDLPRVIEVVKEQGRWLGRSEKEEILSVLLEASKRLDTQGFLVADYVQKALMSKKEGNLLWKTLLAIVEQSSSSIFRTDPEQFARGIPQMLALLEKQGSWVTPGVQEVLITTLRQVLGKVGEPGFNAVDYTYKALMSRPNGSFLLQVLAVALSMILKFQ